ncbi:MAG TPA: winged helix-turn-helix domain-containing protein [Candidatus Micrarchaeia archaeon]|nr:winged helix-turn-helix domain-containing protein [Candidatus Micrarchaeia archaeon]
MPTQDDDPLTTWFDPERDVRLDPRSLRGIAHPLRVRLLAELRDTGPSTATALGRRLGQSSGATSYHLRQLAAYGFVVDVPERARGRERWWQAAHRGTFLDLSAHEDLETNVLQEEYLRSVAITYFQRMEGWVRRLSTVGPEWTGVGTISDVILRLTPDETRQVERDLWVLLERFRRDDPEREPSFPAGAERVELQIQILPQPRPMGGEADPA